MLVNKNQQELLLKDETKKFLNLINKIDKEKPDLKDLREAENMVSNNPSLWHVGRGYAGTVLEQFIDKLCPNKGQQLILKAEAMSIKEKLSYSTSNQSERLIIDQIMLCWVGMNHAERRMHNLFTGGNYSLHTGEYWQENLSRYQNRYLKAIETLTRIRKLNTGIAVQLNIATDGGNINNVNCA